MKKILLIGNPNCGKTTLFNVLTGENQRVGNWPGVTVEKKMGHFFIADQGYELIDLPGVYSLNCTGQGTSPDELVTLNAIASAEIDVIINVVDACSLERHLYLTSQILELGKPVVMALNMMDIAVQRGITIDTAKLEQQLRCAVVPIQAHKKIGFELLYQTLSRPLQNSGPVQLSLPDCVVNAYEKLQQQLQDKTSLSHYYCRRMMEGDTLSLEKFELALVPSGMVFETDLDLILADARYERIHQIVAMTQKKRSDASEHLTARIDRIVLHRLFALPIFLAVMYLIFLFAINVGGIFQDFFDLSSEAIFVQGPTVLLQQIHAPQWLIALLANGVGRGINTTLTFAPVIAAMFFFLALLETSGYMARAAFVVDKIMRRLGLPGKSFVPMIVGFGCNVPAIMAARTLDSEHDRILTILMAPFMSCSARLAIYAVFVAAFFPTGGQNIVFALYLIGILMAVLTGFLLRKTLLKGKPSSLILELPAYHKPSLRRLFRETSIRLRYFIFRAGRIIIPVCVLLGGLSALTIDGGLTIGDANIHSIISLIGQWLTPIFAPMGIAHENWPATVGLLSGMLAKEVVIGTLNSLYEQVGNVTQIVNTHFDIFSALGQALKSIPDNVSHLGEALLNPIAASAPDNDGISKSIYGVMVSRFDGKAGAFAYLLFVLLYIPCVSTMAVIRQEASRQLMWFSTMWSFMLAYVTAVLFYQLATFWRHPQQSLLWLLTLSVAMAIFVMLLRGYNTHSNRILSQRGRHVTTNS